jgi:hypothetical protein
MTEDEFKELPWLHIYAQPYWHSEARIMGTPAALKCLRDAIDAALSSHLETQSVGIVADGEGYHVLVSIATKDELSKEFLPYTDKMANPRMKP